jgi:hypothetical protein
MLSSHLHICLPNVLFPSGPQPKLCTRFSLFKCKWTPPNSSQNFVSNWGRIKHGSIPRPLLFIIDINYLPSTIDTMSEPIIFSDETSVIISSKKFYDFCKMSNIVFLIWVNALLLTSLS